MLPQWPNHPAEAHLVGSMREVHTSHIHSRLNHLLQHLHRSGSWADGTDDARVPGRDGWRVDVQTAHVFQERVGHGCVQLLGLDEGSADIAMGL